MSASEQNCTLFFESFGYGVYIFYLTCLYRVCIRMRRIFIAYVIDVVNIADVTFWFGIVEWWFRIVAIPRTSTITFWFSPLVFGTPVLEPNFHLKIYERGLLDFKNYTTLDQFNRRVLVISACNYDIKMLDEIDETITCINSFKC